jgi:O-antigen ligase
MTRAASARAIGLALAVALLPAGYAMLGLGVVLAGLVAEAYRCAGRLWERTPLDPWIALWLGALLASAAFALYPGTAFGWVLLAGIGLWIGYAPLVRTLRERPRLLHWLLWAWTAGGALAGAVVYGHYLAGGIGGRGTIGDLHPNAAATGLLTASLAGIAATVLVRGRWWLIGLGAQIPILAGLAATQSRGGWAAWAFGLIVLLVLGTVATRRQQWRLRLGAALATAWFAASLLAHPALVERAASLPDPGQREPRLALWRTATRMIAERPLLGVGPGNFGVLYPRYREPDAPDEFAPTAHNLFLNVAAETGIAGLAAFVALLAAALRIGVRRSLRGPPEFRLLRAGVLATMLGAIAQQSVDGTLQTYFSLSFAFWFLLAASVALPERLPRGSAVTRSRQPATERPRRLALSR